MAGGGGWSTQKRSTFASRWDKSTSKAILQGILDAVTLPGDVYRGEVDPRSDEAIGRAFDLAGTMTLGAGAIPAGANEMRMGIKAYHGSPHSFDKFSSERIGTGEGAQAYGHGLYFAENEGVAKGYRESLSNAQLFVEGKKVGERGALGDSPIANAANVLEHHGNDPVAAKAFVADRLAAHKRGGYGYSPQLAESINKEIDGLVGKQIELRPGGNTYEVDIAANPEDFLDWDKPLSEQSPRVQDAVEEMRRTDSGLTQKKVGGEPTGQQVWEAMRSPFVAKQLGYENWSTHGPSEALNKRGIPGIRYLDQGSRKAAVVTAADGSELPHNIAVELRDIYGGDWRAFKEAYKDTKYPSLKAAIDDIDARGGVTYRAEGTSNYVVFDDSLISILKKYGVVGPVLAALGLSQALPDRAEASEQQGGGW